MPSCQRLLADHNNALTGATLSASSVRSAYDQVFPLPTARAGNGEVLLSGGYTGASDALLEVEIRAASGTVARVTQPVLTGAGNGIMTQPSAADGTSSQDITVTLVDLGIATTTAQAILYADALLRAATPGAGGNALRLAITPGITLSALAVGVLGAALARDTQEWTDQKLDFGAVPLNPDGTLPADAPRLVFGRDTSQVYRHYKRWDGHQWQYGVSPRLAAAYAAGAMVHTATGAYTATVSDGVTTETYPGLVTLYDLLLALSASSLVVLATPPANDRQPGGMAAIDLPFRTSAFALPVEKSREALPDLLNLACAETAPTETVTVECIDNRAINAETWKVTSKIAGALANASTGTLYGAGFVGFLIPPQPIEERPVGGRIGLSNTTFVARGEGEGVPDICLYQPLLGAAATNRELRLVWTQRPPEDCLCGDAPVAGRPRDDLLGIDLGEESMAVLAAGHRARLEALTAWLKGFVAANTEKTAAGELRAAEHDINLATLAAGELNECLSDLYTDADATIAEDAWVASTAYAIDAVVEPAARNGYRYRVTVAGTTGSSAPTWPTTVGNTVTDGTVTWKCASKTAPLAWDAVLSGLSSDLSSLSGIGTELPAIAITDGTVNTGATSALGTAALTENVTTVTRTATDGKPHQYRCVGVEVDTGETMARYYLPSHATGLVTALVVMNAASTAVGKIHWLDLGPLPNEAGDVNAIVDLPMDPGILRAPDEFVKRYAFACDEVRAIAGLPPKKSSAGPTGNAVWRDLGTDYWAFAGADYLPAFTNQYYHSATLDCDGNPIPTYEFGFAVRVGCPERLKYGDAVTITIGDIAVQRTYQLGDRYQIPVVQGSPLAFTGGVTGNDTLTWLVRGSSAGALAPYALTAGEPGYHAGGLDFTIHRGGIPFALWDAFRFTVETGGRFRWRKDAEAWSAETAIAPSLALSDGLTATFEMGPMPSFVAGDLYRFRVRQPFAPALAATSDARAWQWTGSGATWTAVLGAGTAIACVGVLRHGLPSGATLSITLQNAGGAPLWSTALTVRPGPLLVFLPAPVIAHHVALAVGNALGAAIGWIYAGNPWAAENSADECVLRRVYALERASGLDADGAYLGAGRGGELRWTSWFGPADWASLLALLDDAKSRGDAPVVLVPNLTDTADAALVRVSTDTLEITDEYRFQDPSGRMMSLTLPFDAVVV